MENVALVHEARRLTTGANVHELTGALAMYRTAAAAADPASQEAARRMECDLAAEVKRLRAQRARAGK